ncbi:hypothetical protein LTR37_009726 [Vermiconidia calcicola]|uniref:Uncharacterized protein n=1 Tax=Vermiconidia calcicola TaxID=1690605 RepID=A0ACC3N8N4_9PEZI|nr:hypothetical protein LTR37_009726 [Vermiconidia calcicola]
MSHSQPAPSDRHIRSGASFGGTLDHRRTQNKTFTIPRKPVPEKPVPKKPVGKRKPVGKPFAERKAQQSNLDAQALSAEPNAPLRRGDGKRAGPSTYSTQRDRSNDRHRSRGLRRLGSYSDLRTRAYYSSRTLPPVPDQQLAQQESQTPELPAPFGRHDDCRELFEKPLPRVPVDPPLTSTIARTGIGPATWRAGPERRRDATVLRPKTPQELERVVSQRVQFEWRNNPPEGPEVLLEDLSLDDLFPES